MRLPSVVLCIAFVSVQVMITGCSILNSDRSAAADPAVSESNIHVHTASKGEKLIAADLVHALAQIPMLRPEQTELHVSDPVNNFELYLQEALFNAGYKLSSNPSDRRLPSVISTITPDSQLETVGAKSMLRTYQIDIADVKIKRGYYFDGNAVLPEPEMYFKGVDTIRIELDDSIFHAAVSEESRDFDFHHVRNNQQDGPVSKFPLPVNVQADSAENSSVDRSTAPVLQLNLISPTNADHFNEGDLINLVVESAVDTQLYCYYQDGLGNVARLFPNRFQPDNHLRAGQSLRLPESDSWYLTATRSGASESFLCIAGKPELSERFLTFANQPDLQTLPEKNLQQIYDNFSSAAGAELENRMISLSVQ